MFDIGMSELLIVGVVALIVVGPKDLPGMFKAFGKFTARIRAMSREFTRAMEQAADDTGVGDIGNSLKAATNPAKFGLDKLSESVNDAVDWDPTEFGEASVPERSEMTEERAEMAKKISDNASKVATERAAAEKAEAEAKAAKKPAPKKASAKKPAAKKPAAKKPAAKKAAPKKKSTPKPKSDATS